MYVFFLAREARLPVQCQAPCRSDAPGEGHQPPLAYALAAPALLWLPREERIFDLPSNWRFTWAGGTQINAVAHGSREHWPWQGEVLAWHLARLVNVALGVFTVMLVANIGRKMAGPASGLWAAALVAFNPQFLFTSGLLTNDALLVLLCAAILAVIIPERQATPPVRAFGQALMLGVLFGLALITKQSALLLGPLLALWCVVGMRAALPSLGEAIRSWQLIMARGVILFGVTTLLSGWWYLRNTQLYGDPIALAVFQAEFTTQAFEPGKLDAWQSALATLHESFWARFGWMNLPAPAWALSGYALIEGLALLGGALALRQGSFSARLMRAWPLLLLFLLAFAWLVSFAFTAGLVAWQGRLLFPALPAVAVLLGWGLAALSERLERLQPVLRRAFSIGLIGSMAGVAAWMPVGVIQPAYPFQTLPPAVAVARLGTPVYARFAARPDERGATLRGYRIDGQVRPDETITITLMWNALGRQNRAWWVFLHLVDDQENILAEDNREPRDGQFKMSQWVAGDWIEDAHPLTLPADLAPGTYRLRVGLWYPTTGRRAGWFSAGERLLGDSYDLGTITVEAKP
jgi:4-amino-4-deoxy-L-arabinose transferase-like glycosyltransferase